MAAVPRAIALALLVPLAGCMPAVSRTASRSCAPIEQECRVNITNSSSQNVVVYYRGAGKQELLGSVPAGGTTAVTIADASVRGTVSLVAQAESATQIVCSRNVRLSEAGVADFYIVDTCNPRRNYPPVQKEAPGEQPPTPPTPPTPGSLEVPPTPVLGEIG